MHTFLATTIIFFVLFLIWNNAPQIVETIGQFLVAHARGVRMRSQFYKDLTGGVK
jgi:hypothetical protein